VISLDDELLGGGSSEEDEDELELGITPTVR
jgi:hypothetical protein